MTCPPNKTKKTKAIRKASVPKVNLQCKAEVSPKVKPGFPIVGVGASAGGLEAFVELLKNLDVKSGMAFVLVQHLDPKHESLLSEILSRATSMPLCEVTDGTKVVPDHVFVMPPNVQMTIAADKLHLEPRDLEIRGLHLPIDCFLKSLAAEHKGQSIGIILSGTGSDGANGIAAIIAEGGVTFAESLSTAKFEGMPKAAIASGAEYVLKPKAIARELLVIARSAHSNLEKQDTSIETKPVEFQKVLSLLNDAKKMNFTHYKFPTIQRRIQRRITLNKLSNGEDYANYLRENPAELDRLYEDILIKVTSFFRSPESFEALSKEVFPAIMEQNPRPETIRVWVPGCSTGEEAFSIAICLLEYFDEIGSRSKVEIFATDVSDRALAKARLGIYDESIAEIVSAKRLNHFFIKEPGVYRIGPRVRECCVFAKQNLASDPPFSKIDLISCRNLLIYLTPQIQKRILATFNFALKPGGFLVLGNAETIGAATDMFKVSDNANKIFVKKAGVRGGLVPNYVMDALGKRLEDDIKFPSTRPEPSKKTDVKMNADRVLLARFVPPRVIINEQMDVLEVRGDTSAFLVHPSGEITANLSKLCRPGLLVELRHAVHEASTSGEPVAKVAMTKRQGRQLKPVGIEVVPFDGLSSSERYFAVLFKEMPESEKEIPEPSLDEMNETRRVERELAETKNFLNAIIEKEQATNEELKSASEEILSANEELQSTNEEMATAKEETQATNEELTTVNDELENRNHELGQLNGDLSNLLGSVQIPILMLTDKLIVRRFTLSAEKLFGLSHSDIGRPLSELAAKIQLDGLPQLVTEVIESLNTKDQDIQSRDGRWYSLRIKPYRTSDNKIEGAVVALVDIDAFKCSFEHLKETYNFAEAIVQTAPVPLLILDEKLNIAKANQAFCRHFQIEESETENVRIYDLGNGQWNVPELRELLEDILPKNEVMENFIIDHNFVGLGRKTLRLSARRLVQKKDELAKILLAIQDLTTERRTEEDITLAKEAAENANRAKSDFLANMSHEIRTPLGVILGFSELLSATNQTKASILNSATRIRKNVEHLMELINEILDIAKIEAGKLEVDLVRFALLPELAETFALLQNRAEGKGLALNINFHGEIPEFIVCCPKKLRQILFNIIGNAIKFTDQGGVNVDISVKLLSEKEDSRKKLSFDVKDSGFGISVEKQFHLFKAFSQVDSSLTRRFGGSGLGLMLARRLAQALGGDVRLSNSVVGEGSTFNITVDTGPLDNVKMFAGVTQESLKSHKVKILDWFVSNQKLKDVDILLVEDGPDNQALFSCFLSSSGARVDLATNGAEALKIAHAKDFDLILMDLQMPVIDGYEATKRLRDAGFLLPIVALTAQAMAGEREKCLSLGFSDYLSKPVKPNVLVDLLVSLVKKKT